MGECLHAAFMLHASHVFTLLMFSKLNVMTSWTFKNARVRITSKQYNAWSRKITGRSQTQSNYCSEAWQHAPASTAQHTLWWSRGSKKRHLLDFFWSEHSHPCCEKILWASILKWPSLKGGGSPHTSNILLPLCQVYETGKKGRRNWCDEPWSGNRIDELPNTGPSVISTN